MPSYPKRASSSGQGARRYSLLMNQKELISALAKASGTDSKNAAAMIPALTDIILERVGSGDFDTILRLAKFSLVDRAARAGRNPQERQTCRQDDTNKGLHGSSSTPFVIRLH